MKFFYVILVCLWCSPRFFYGVIAEEEVVVPVFSAEMVEKLKIPVIDQTYREYFRVFTRFEPQDKTQMEWCFELSGIGLITNDMVFEKLKGKLYEDDLCEVIIRYLKEGNQEQIGLALKLVETGRLEKALPTLRKIEAIKKPPYDYYYYRSREIRAKLQDPVLLADLTCLEGQTPDSTLAKHNRELLYQYGDEGIARLMKLKGKSQDADTQIEQVLFERGDVAQVPDLIKDFRKTKDYSKRKKILQQLLKLKSRECNEFFGELLASGDDNFGSRDWVERVYYDFLTEELATTLERQRKRGTNFNSFYPYRGREIVEKELLLALYFVEKLSSTKGSESYLASCSLQAMTGQKFQYLAPPIDDYARAEIEQKTRQLPNDALSLEMLENAQARELGWNDNNTTISTEIRQKKRDGIIKKYDELRKKFEQTPDWEIGIPRSKAKQWVVNYYHPTIIVGESPAN